MASIDEYLAARDEYYKRTGKWLSYGYAVAKFKHLNTRPLPAGMGDNSRRRLVPNTSANRVVRAKLTPTEIELIRGKYLNGCTTREIASALKITGTTVLNQLKKMGIYESETHKSWSREEEDLLRDFFYHDVSVSDIAGMLQRSEHSVRSRISHLGLQRSRK